jgi:hypothetical protein
MSVQCAPLWHPVASSAYASLLSGEEKMLLCALTWDSSPVGWAALARWWCHAVPEPARPAAGRLRAGRMERLRAAVPRRVGQCPRLRGIRSGAQHSLAIRVPQNDACAAIASFRKGSTQSPRMQSCALCLDQAAVMADVDCLPYHVPGLTLVAEGIDGA